MGLHATHNYLTMTSANTRHCARTHKTHAANGRTARVMLRTPQRAGNYAKRSLASFSHAERRRKCASTSAFRDESSQHPHVSTSRNSNPTNAVAFPDVAAGQTETTEQQTGMVRHLYQAIACPVNWGEPSETSPPPNSNFFTRAIAKLWNYQGISG